MVDEPQDIHAIGRSTNVSNGGAIFDIRENIGFLLSRAYRYIASVCSEEFASYGITLAQFIVLMHLEGCTSDSQVCLSQKTGIDRTTIVGIIDRLEQKGLVARTKVAEDRRVRRVVLTDYGLELKNDFCIAAKRVRSRLTSKISPEEYVELVRLLTRLHE
jgi:DNA-binding MarR family transcriptional regulator